MASTRVLQVLGRSAGGIATHVAQLVASLDGTDDLVVDVAGPSDLPIAMPKAITPVLIPDGLLGHRRAIAALRSIVTARNYDLVHAHGLRAGIDSGLAARDARAVVATTVHNLVQPEIAGRVRAVAYRRAESSVVRVSDKVFTVSEQIAQHLRRSVGDAPSMNKIEVLHLGVGGTPKIRLDRRSARASVGVDPSAPLIVSASRLSPQKALHVLLEAMTKLDPEVLLVIAGEGPLEAALKEQADAAGLSERVRFTGFRSDVADLIAAADVFCLSSIWEGVPLSAQEAILLGVPVVATDVGGMSELIADGTSGRLVPRDDSGALADALREVLGSPELRATFAEKARRDLDKNFSTQAMLARLTDFYKHAATVRS
jgi:glycosyltransferase involved in cell wall biosynthesis